MNANNSSVHTLMGRVVSIKRDKTITVLIERKIKHVLIGKIITRTNKLHAHDENNEYQLGDIVLIQESKPISKTKNWRAISLVSKNSLTKS